MKYNKQFVIEFGNLCRTSTETTEKLFTELESKYTKEHIETKGIYMEVLEASSEMCGVTMDELHSGQKYGDIPTCKQITSKILSEMRYSEENIAANLPALGKRGTVHSQIKAAGEYEEHNKTYRVVLNQMRSKFEITETTV